MLTANKEIRDLTQFVADAKSPKDRMRALASWLRSSADLVALFPDMISRANVDPATCFPAFTPELIAALNEVECHVAAVCSAIVRESDGVASYWGADSK